MKEKNKGITLIKFIFIIVIILLVVFIIFSLTYFKNLCSKVDIAYKTITNQIDIEKQIEENEKLMGTTDVTGEGIIINILDGNDLIHQEDLVIILDDKKSININMNDIYSSLYNIYSL